MLIISASAPATSASGNSQQPRKLEVKNEEQKDLDQKMGDMKIQDSLPHTVSYLYKYSCYIIRYLIDIVYLVVLFLNNVVISIFYFCGSFIKMF